MNKRKSSKNIFPFYPFLVGKNRRGKKLKFCSRGKNESGAEYIYTPAPMMINKITPLKLLVETFGHATK